MKKIISLLLSIAMIFSLAMPAMAAEITGNTETPTVGNVTASYTPSTTEDTTATITGVSIQVGGETYTSGTVTLTPDSGDVTIIVSGTNLQNRSADNKVKPNSFSSINMGSEQSWDVSDDGTKASKTLPISDFTNITTAFEIGYCNDGSTNYTGSGVYVIYDDGTSEEDKAVITGVSIQVGGETYTSGNVTLTPASGDVTIIVSGTNLQNKSANNVIEYASGTNINMSVGQSWDVSDDGTKASKTLPISDFVRTTTAFEIKYCNDGSTNYTGSGVYVIYDDGTGEEDPVTFPDPLYLNTLKAINGYSWNNSIGLVCYDSEGNGSGYILGTKIAEGLYSFTGIPDGTAKVNFVNEWEVGSTVDLTPVAGCDMYVMDGGTDDSGNRTGSWSVYDHAVSTVATITGLTIEGGHSIVDVGDAQHVFVVDGGAGITITVTGENFAALTNNHLFYGSGYTEGITAANGWTIDTENNTAVKSFTPADMVEWYSSLLGYENPGDDYHDTPYQVFVLKPGTTLKTIYFNTGGNSEWTNVTVDFLKSYYGFMDWPSVGTNSMTMKETNIYATQGEIPDLASCVTFKNGSTTISKLEIPTDGRNMYNLADGTWSVYTPSTPEDTTSAEIVWGSMSFTYDDTIDESTKAEKGWSNDVTGGGTVTVKNTSDTAFTAKVTYTAVAEYAEITGTFDADSADLVAEDSKTFTLTLKNKPNKAITAGTKIGSVTIEIVNDSGASGEDESDVTIVTDEQGLIDAIAQGGKIKLGDSFTISIMDIRNNVTIDLNSKTLTTTANGLYVHEGATLNVSNGTISGNTTVYNIGGTVFVEGCALTGEANAFVNTSGTLSLQDCTVNGCVYANGGTVTLYETITFGHGTGHEIYTGITCSGGNVLCHFDPTGHIKIGSLSNNGDGTWTVSPKAAE